MILHFCYSNEIISSRQGPPCDQGQFRERERESFLPCHRRRALFTLLVQENTHSHAFPPPSFPYFYYFNASQDEDPIARAVLAWQVAGGEEPAAVAQSSRPVAASSAAPVAALTSTSTSTAVEAETSTAAAAPGASTPPRRATKPRAADDAAAGRAVGSKRGRGHAPARRPLKAPKGAPTLSPASTSKIASSSLPRAVSGGSELTRGDSKVALALAMGAVAKGIGSSG